MAFSGELGVGQLGSFELAFISSTVPSVAAGASSGSDDGAGMFDAMRRRHKQLAKIRRDDDDVLALLSTLWRHR